MEQHTTYTNRPWENEELRYIYFKSTQYISYLKNMKNNFDYSYEDFFDIYEVEDIIGKTYVYRFTYYGASANAIIITRIKGIIPELQPVNMKELTVYGKLIKPNAGVEYKYKKTQ